jgi:hypothetical protein
LLLKANDPVLGALRGLLARNAEYSILNVNPSGSGAFNFDWSESRIKAHSHKTRDLPTIRTIPVFLSYLFFGFLEALGQITHPTITLLTKDVATTRNTPVFEGCISDFRPFLSGQIISWCRGLILLGERDGWLPLLATSLVVPPFIQHHYRLSTRALVRIRGFLTSEMRQVLVSV